jgi:hypothetical protein
VGFQSREHELVARPSLVRQDDHLGAAFRQVFYGLCVLTELEIFRDLSAIYMCVKIYPKKDSFPSHVDILKRSHKIWSYFQVKKCWLPLLKSYIYLRILPISWNS